MNAGDKLSIIMLVHNHIAMTRQCLDSLSHAVAYLDHEVILLDNSSSEDATPLRDGTGLFRNLRCLRSEENLSFSRGNNLCAAQAAGNFLLFLNNDVFLNPGSVERMLECLRDGNFAGIVGGMLLFPGRGPVQHAGMQQMLWGFPSNYGVGARPDDERVRQAGEPFALTGAMLCLRKDVFRTVGGFDERYIWGYEDVDICLKIRSAGLRVIYEPGAAGTHVESATLKLTQNQDGPGNYRIYRETWDPVLVPREQAYLHRLKQQGIRSVAVFGTGMAALGLSRILNDNGIRIEAFTSTEARAEGETFLDRPVLPLASLREVKFDRLMVASQFFFAVEPLIRDLDPLRAPIYPVLI